MQTTIQFRRGTSAEWLAKNPVLAPGEPGFDSTKGAFKIGDGVTAWNSLGNAGGARVNLGAAMKWNPSVDAGATIDSILTNDLNMGGVLHVPGGFDWKTSMEHSLPTSVTVQGEGSDPNGTKGSSLRQTTNNYSTFKIDGNLRNIAVKDINLKAGTATGTTRGVLCAGAVGTATIGVTCENVCFFDFASGLEVYSSFTTDPFEVEQLQTNRCHFINCYRGFACNSNNSSMVHLQPFFILGAGGTAFYLDLVGELKILGHNCVSFAAKSTGTTFVFVNQNRLAITIESGQDENIRYFIKTGINNFTENPIILNGNLIQSDIQLNGATKIRSIGNRYPANCYKDAPGAVSSVYADPTDYVVNVDALGATVSGTPTMKAFSNGSNIYMPTYTAI